MTMHDSRVIITEATTPICMTYSGRKLALPDEAHQAIDEHWNTLISDGGRFTRGDVFAIVSVEQTPEQLQISADLTDYAHYLYTRRQRPGGERWPCRLVHSGVLIESSDNHLLFGLMAAHTSSPDTLQCAGGGLTREDISLDKVDIHANAARELLEETGIRYDDPSTIESFQFAYLKSGGAHGSFAAIYVAKSLKTADQLQQIFFDHNRRLAEEGETPEFGKLLAVAKTVEAVETFLARADYAMEDCLAPLLRAHVQSIAGVVTR